MMARLPLSLRVAMRALPSGFRERNSADLLDHYGDMLGRERRVMRRGRLTMRAIGDVLTMAPQLHMRERARRKRARLIAHRRPERIDMLHHFLQDAKYAVRGFAKNPMFAFIAIFTLALGIGSATVIFSLVNGVLLQPMAYREPERLMVIWNDFGGEGGQTLPAVSIGDYYDYRTMSETFEDFAAGTGGNSVGAQGVVTSAGVSPQQVSVSALASHFLPLLGVTPVVGRQFTPEEEKIGADPVVMLTHPLWMARFAGDRSVIGTKLEVDGVQREIVGVLPENFRLMLPAEVYSITDADLYIPLILPPVYNGPRNLTILTVIGRLKPGVTYAQAQAEMKSIAGRLQAEHPVHAGANLRIRAVPYQDDVVKAARAPLMLLVAAVGLLVLIACANVANLLLARASSRQLELSVRAAVGASRKRVVQQLLTESLLLAVAAGALGFALAAGALELVTRAQPNVPRLEDVGIDWTVLGFVFALSCFTAFLFGLAPVLYGIGGQVSSVLRGGVRAGTRSPHVRNALVVAEIALSLVLLVGAGLLIRSFTQLQRVQPGFVPEQSLTFGLSLPGAAYRDFATRIAFTNEVTRRLRELPGVTAVGVTSHLPMTGIAPLQPYAHNDATAAKWESVTADMMNVGHGYFDAMGTKLVEGRTFDPPTVPPPPPADGAANQAQPERVVIIDEMIAKQAWPNESAIGKRIQLEQTGEPDAFGTVIGVAEHVRMHDLSTDGLPQIYHPTFAPRRMNFVLRTSGPTEQTVAGLRRVIGELDPNLPVDGIQPIANLFADGLARARFTLVLMQAVGGLALILATVGLYGVLAYFVGQRSREFGVRLALGATPTRLRFWVVLHGMKLVLASLVVGLVAAIYASRFIRSQLFGVAPTDPMTFVAVSMFLTMVAVLACYLPARRASRSDPLTAFRDG